VTLATPTLGVIPHPLCSTRRGWSNKENTQNVDRRRNYGPRSKSKMAAVRHLGFSKIWFVSTGTPRAADFPSRCKIWCKTVDRRRNYGRKSKSKMAAVRHLGFVTSSYRTTHKVLSLVHIGLSNFMVIRCIVLKIWRFEIFADLAWNTYSAPKILVFGAKIGEGIFGFRPQCNQFFRFRPQRFLPNFVKIGWKMWP